MGAEEVDIELVRRGRNAETLTPSVHAPNDNSYAVRQVIPHAVGTPHTKRQNASFDHYIPR